ncbi:MAG TPA: glycosyl transferase [Bacteroidales bacterium]|nr:MAG: hypothetical protein A2X11_07215 [Bacteroidetes bacterium GWE2_42_24]OFY29544.1 MAG: hypothetical protein A2X09_04385 [Bacteroidetes bacterium GWF2_43_11]HAQ64748.1 glycosyl transferase [Bacteroidales bacterium]HBZ67346.1 glycosyl transferase [Bacteroidales bacterium]
MKVICLGNYLPRQCGIATFTVNLVHSIISAAEMNGSAVEVEVIAMNDNGNSYSYPPIVSHTISDSDPGAYIEMAGYINRSGADVLLLQHEYGIFGGESGVLLLHLLRRVSIPVVVTFHTVFQQPGFHQKEVLKKVAGLATRIVIMNGLAIGFLTDIYGVPAEKIVRIPHGVPDFESSRHRLMPAPPEWKGRTVILTFGLIGRSKGLETVIRALPKVVERHPEILYVVLGKTHPNVVRYSGEEYREYLQQIIGKLGLGRYVMFIDRYVDELELMSLLKAADLYVTPYLSKTQITSGTLSYAIGGGCAVISTPYWHAEELLQDGRGLLFEFQDDSELARHIILLIDQPDVMKKMQEAAYAYGQSISWSRTGDAYLTILQQVGRETNEKHEEPAIDYPPIDFRHMHRMTFPEGILQHSLGAVPSLRHGFCLDDNARALLVALKACQLGLKSDVTGLITRYLTYIQLMQQPDGSFKNYLTFDRVPLDDDFPDDAFGRATWALGYLIRYAPGDSLMLTANEMFNRLMPHIGRLKYARGYANCILGLFHYVKRFPDQERFISLIIQLADNLCVRYYQHHLEDWHWFEDSLTYDNGLIPAALYMAHELTCKDEYLYVAGITRKFLEEKCFINSWLSLVGNKRWQRFSSSYELYAQQPIDALAMVLMYECAFKATGDRTFISQMLQSFRWFLGENDLGISVYDFETKGCNDGIEEKNINRNQGAESTMAWLMARLTVEPYLIF